MITSADQNLPVRPGQMGHLLVRWRSMAAHSVQRHMCRGPGAPAHTDTHPDPPNQTHPPIRPATHLSKIQRSTGDDTFCDPVQKRTPTPIRSTTMPPTHYAFLVRLQLVK